MVYFLIAVLRAVFSCQQFAQSLSQIRMTICPIQDSVELPSSFFFRPSECLGKRCRFLKAEVSQLNPMANVKRRATDVRNEVRRTGHAEQDKTEATQPRISSARIVAGPNRYKEIIRMGEPDCGIDLVHENDDVARCVGQDHISKKFGEPLDGGDVFAFAPPGFQIIFDCKRTMDHPGNAVVPAVYRFFLPLSFGPNLTKIDNGHFRVRLVAESLSRMRHQTRLAHLSAGQHIAELTCETALE